MWLHRKTIMEKKKNRKDSRVPTGNNNTGRQPKEKQCWGLSNALRPEGTQEKQSVGEKQKRKRSKGRENNWLPVEKKTKKKKSNKQRNKGLKYRDSMVAMRYLCWKSFPHGQCSILNEQWVSKAELVTLQFYEGGEIKIVVIKNVNVLCDVFIYWESPMCAELFKQTRYPLWREEQSSSSFTNWDWMNLDHRNLWDDFSYHLHCLSHIPVTPHILYNNHELL